MLHEAKFWQKEPHNKVKCMLCPHNCIIYDGNAGICRARINRNGTLYTAVYSNLAAIHTDPIEKKPLYHFYPGREILSVGTSGCNLRCLHCQNHNLSQSVTFGSQPHNNISPNAIVNKAEQIPNNIGVAYTYNEPTVFYELLTDCALQIHKAGLKNVVVSNGYINAEPLQQMLPLIDAFNIDLKAFSDEFYRKVTGGRLSPVLETLKTIAHAGKHLEITMLVIPTLNDSTTEFTALIEWIYAELGADIPLHLSRYFPAWKLAIPPTPETTLNKFAELAVRKLNFVFIGNIDSTEHSSTFCPSCKCEVIARHRYAAKITGIDNNSCCIKCGLKVKVMQ